jgi:hypothetical protein
MDKLTVFGDNGMIIELIYLYLLTIKLNTK